MKKLCKYINAAVDNVLFGFDLPLWLNLLLIARSLVLPIFLSLWPVILPSFSHCSFVHLLTTLLILFVAHAHSHLVRFACVSVCALSDMQMRWCVIEIADSF